MNCELFSIRGSQEEINRLNQNLGNIVSRLSTLDIQILFKTELDRSTSKIEEAIIESVNDVSSPEIIIIANALDKESGADFISVFSKIIYNWETRCKNSMPISERGKKFHVKIFPIENLGHKNSGYCFTIYNTRIVVLPCETAAQKPIAELIYKGAFCALDIFKENNLLYPDGFDFSENAGGLKDVEDHEKEMSEKDYPDSEDPETLELDSADDSFSGESPVSSSDPFEETEVSGVSNDFDDIRSSSEETVFTDISSTSDSSDTASAETEDIYSNSSGADAGYEDISSVSASNDEPQITNVVAAAVSEQRETIDFISGPLSPKAAKKIEKIKLKENKKREKANAKAAKKEAKRRKKEAKREKKKQKKGFFRKNFPCRGDRPGEIARKSIILVALVTIIVCVCLIVNEMVILPAQNQKLQNDIKNIFYNKTQATRPDSLNLGTTEESESTEATKETDETEESASTETTEETEATQGSENNQGNISSYNWDALKEINSEIIGWISIDNTVIDYPVLCHENDPAGTTDPYYLSHNYLNQWDSYGAIFTDPTSYTGLDTKNIVLHGHHMNDGSMFGNLVYYGTGFADGNGTPYVNMGFYQSSPVIHFNTPEWTADWKIIAVIHTNALESHGEFFNYLQGNFSSDEEFLNFVYNVRERSIINTDVDVNENDQLLTLSTCTYEFENFRTAVIARRVRPGEDSSVNVYNASVNTDMIWPDVYYWTYGGTKPESKTFAEAYSNGEISWYDGQLYG